MSFSVDLWNGFDQIKNKIYSIRKEMKNFQKMISNYIYYEKEYIKNLDYIFKDSFENSIPDSPLEQCRIAIIKMFDFEAKQRKELINAIEKNIVEDLSSFLNEPKNNYDYIFVGKDDSEQSFNKSFNKLVNKQENFHSQCKEFCLTVGQTELDKKAVSKLNKMIPKLVKSRDDYLDNINEVNIERAKFNMRNEKFSKNDK